MHQNVKQRERMQEQTYFDFFKQRENLPVVETTKLEVTLRIIFFKAAMSFVGILPDASIMKAISMTTGHSQKKKEREIP